MHGVAIGEAALDAAMAVVGLAVLPGDHADDFLAAHLRLEGAAHAAIGAGGHLAVLRLADFDHRLLDQGRRRAGLHAGAAGHTFRFEEGLVHSGRHAALEAASADRQREGALHFLASAHAAIADDALGRIKGEIGVRLVLRLPIEIGRAILAREDVVGAVVTVAHVAQPDRARHVLQFAVAVGGAGEAVERMVRDVKLHHAPADGGEAGRLRLDVDARRDRGGAGGRRAVASLDLDEAKAAGAEGLNAVGRAELGNFDSRLHRGPHDGCPFRNRDTLPVNSQGNEFR